MEAAADARESSGCRALEGGVQAMGEEREGEDATWRGAELEGSCASDDSTESGEVEECDPTACERRLIPLWWEFGDAPRPAAPAASSAAAVSAASRDLRGVSVELTDCSSGVGKAPVSAPFSPRWLLLPPLRARCSADSALAADIASASSAQSLFSAAVDNRPPRSVASVGDPTDCARTLSWDSDRAMLR